MALSGPISVRQNTTLDVMKGTRSPFLTTVKITNTRYGVNLKVLSYGRDAVRAGQSGLFFVGEAVNLLALRLNRPLYLNLIDQEIETINHSTKKVMSAEEWRSYFTLGRDYGQTRSVFSRAISWYRKGLNSDDPIDKLLATWLSLEVIAYQYGNKIGASKSHITNQMVSCLNALWGSEKDWKVIPSRSDWLEVMRKKRNDIAHGNSYIVPEYIQMLSDEVLILQELAQAFLIDWEQRSDLENG